MGTSLTVVVVCVYPSACIVLTASIVVKSCKEFTPLLLLLSVLNMNKFEAEICVEIGVYTSSLSKWLK